jgi:hypothetical protein
VSSLTEVWEAAWGLLVEDGSLAVGILVALAITWAAAITVPESMQDRIGWLLLAMLVLLVVLNLRAAGLTARRRLTGS